MKEEPVIKRARLNFPIFHLPRKGFAASVILLGVFSNGASAANCIDQVQKIAHDYGLAIDPPDAGTAITPEELARSGGVIEPPAVGDQAVIEPPVPRSAMPTTPDLPSLNEDLVQKNSLDASDRLVLEGILISARAEANRGDVEGCFKRLQKAQKIINNRSG